MTVTKYLTLDSTDWWLGTANVPVNIMLLRDDVTAADINDAYQYPTAFFSLSIPFGGGYDNNGGIVMPSLTRRDNVTAGVTEYDVGSAVWTSAATFTVSNFRWLLIYSVPPLGLWDLGASHGLTGQPLSLDVAPSPYTPGVYPILSFKKNLA